MSLKATVLAAAAFTLVNVSALAADLRVPAATPFTWTGCYAGGSIGGGWGEKDLTDTAGFLSGLGGPGSASLDIDGYMLGGQIGCDYQFASGFVLGVEGYAAGGRIGRTGLVTVPGDNATFKDTTNLLTGGTARVGYAWGRWLSYVRGGVAWASDNYTVADNLGLYDAVASEDRFGWTAGGGVEWALWRDWSVRLEYDYYGFGTRNVTFTDNVSGVSGPVDVKQAVQVVTLGLNFHVFADENLAP